MSGSKSKSGSCWYMTIGNKNLPIDTGTYSRGHILAEMFLKRRTITSDRKMDWTDIMANDLLSIEIRKGIKDSVVATFQSYTSLLIP